MNMCQTIFDFAMVMIGLLSAIIGDDMVHPPPNFN